MKTLKDKFEVNLDEFLVRGIKKLEQGAEIDIIEGDYEYENSDVVLGLFVNETEIYRSGGNGHEYCTVLAKDEETVKVQVVDSPDTYLFTNAEFEIGYSR